MSSTAATDADTAPPLDPARLGESHAFQELSSSVLGLEAGRKLCAGGLWGSSQAWALSALFGTAQGPWLIVLSSETEAEAFADDLRTLGADPVALPARESYSSGGSAHADPDSIRRRLQVTQKLAGPPETRPRFLIASLLSLLQPIPSPRDLEQDFLHLQTGQKLDLEDLLERLISAGYTRQPLAERPGEVSLRGDILDVFSFAADTPVRVELFDDEIESLRLFDPESQRSIDSTSKLALCIASDAGGIEDGKGVLPINLLSGASVVVEIEPLRIEETAEGLRVQSSAHARSLIELRRHLDGMRRLQLQSLPGADLSFTTRSVQALGVGIKEAPGKLHGEADMGSEIVVLCNGAGETRRIQELLERDTREGGNGTPITVRNASLARGFRLPEQNLIVINHRELIGVPGARRQAAPKKRYGTRALDSFFDLKIGDLVVHAVHGVARFHGLALLERSGAEEEHLHLLFANEVSVYVPASRLDLVQRYVGSGSASPELDKIGSQAFRKRKEKVERAIIDLAAELLEIQAKRELHTRDAWEVDADLVRAMIDEFPYVDTEDQAKADVDIGADLGKARPMDRLLCGDVGFGKTEVAVRAAFRVVSAGAQVAVLVPTTVLARQHGETFRERLADFPVEVGSVSRYVTGKQAKDVLARTARGEIDILIGTHRLLSKDVVFKHLGLVIIDEEQRFGVQHKEHFKALRSAIDILTLTATPIPRTLHMSLSGLRDISALSQPPPGRQEIETLIVASQDRTRVREAILREKNRGGQVFFLHNRVQSIERAARELLALVPECSYAIGHGQMPGRKLARVMDSFTRGEVDVLVATTIVENGIDIPSAGTILIDDADRFGLAELHQLRGRVGRGSHKAYCYLLIDRTKPVRDIARQRIKALEELTQLGAGFQISMKDLEIRGAGNILGPQQSGNIAAIGYDMYCRLLKQTVERIHTRPDVPSEPEDIGPLLQEIPAQVTREIEANAVELELGIRALLPKSWIPTAEARLKLLRKLNEVQDDKQADDMLAMLRDRYGRVPEEAVALVDQFRLRPHLVASGISRLLYRQDTYLIEYADRVLLEGLFAGAGVELRPLRAGKAHLVIPASAKTPASALKWLRGYLETRAQGTGSGGFHGGG